MRIATGEEADDVIDDGKDPAAKALGAKGGRKRAELSLRAFYPFFAFSSMHQ